MDDIDTRRLAAGLVLAAQSGVESVRERWDRLPREAQAALAKHKDAAKQAAEVVEAWLADETDWESVRRQAKELAFWCQWSVSAEVVTEARKRAAALLAVIESMERTSDESESDTDSSAA